jgi:putative SOS response-associated peptidase YedK
MCGRFTLFEPDKILSREFGISSLPSLSPRYNIAPSQPVAAVRAASAGTGRELAFLRWGLIPSWSKDLAIGNRLINVRAETAREKPSFRNAFRRHRCFIPTNGSQPIN